MKKQRVQPANPASPSPSTKNHGFRRFMVLSILVVQVLWALVVPIKNVAMIAFPNVQANRLFTNAVNYTTPTLEDYEQQVLSGVELDDLLRQVANITLGNARVYRQFANLGGMRIDQLTELLTVEEHHTMMKYYAVLLQQSQYPGFRYVPMKIDAVLVNTSTISDINVTISCPKETPAMRGVVCRMDGSSCYASPGWKNKQLEPVVSLETFGGAFNNSLALLHLVNGFHFYLNQWFIRETYVEHQYDPRAPFWNSETSRWSLGAAGIPKVYTSPNIESCYLTMKLMNAVLSNHSRSIVEDALIAFGHWKREDSHSGATVYKETKRIVNAALNQSISLTNGAFGKPVEIKSDTLFGVTLTRTMTSVGQIKGDFDPTGTITTHGSPASILSQVAAHPYWYGYDRYEFTQDKTLFEPEFMGSLYAGLNVFTFKWFQNTKQTYKLRELPPQPMPWWDQEKALHNWFKAWMWNDSSTEIIGDFFNTTLMDEDKTMQCRAGFYSFLAGSMLRTMLKLSENMASFLMFLSMREEGINNLLPTEYEGFPMETAYATWNFVPFPSWNVGPYMVQNVEYGHGWPLVPMVYHLMQAYEPKEVEDAWFNIVNKTTDVKIERLNENFDYLIHFWAQFGWGCLLNRGISDELRKDHGLGQHNLMQKLEPNLRGIFQRLVTKGNTLMDQMQSDTNIHVPIAPVLLYWSFDYSADTNLTHTPLQIGLLRLLNKSPAPQLYVDQARNATVCYETVWMQNFTTKVQCYHEPKNYAEARVSSETDGLRKLLSSIWSIGLIVNILVAYISLRFAFRVYNVFRITGFRDIDVATALDMDVQGPEILTIKEVFVMACCAIPLLVSLHLIPDEQFLQGTVSSNTYTVLETEALVGLSLSWFVRLGIGLGTHVFTIHYPTRWNYIWIGRFRLVLMLLGTLFHYLLPATKQSDSSAAIGKLIGTLVFTTVISFLMIAMDSLMPAMATKDSVNQALAEIHVNRHRFGVQGFSGGRWALSGLLMEGWRMASFDDNENSSMSLVRDSFVLTLDEKGNTISSRKRLYNAVDRNTAVVQNMHYD